MTPLMAAAKHGHTNIVLTLLIEGADTDRKTADDLTALKLAELGGHTVIVDLFKYNYGITTKQSSQLVLCSVASTQTLGESN